MNQKPSYRPEPPKWATRFLHWYCHPDLLDEVEGDLYELFQRRVETQGLWKAKAFYCFNVLMFLHPNYIRKRKKYHPVNHIAMFKNYFIISLRNLLSKKFYAVINILGLSIGLTCCMFIFLYVDHELSYDTFHIEKDRIYRVITTFTEAGTEINYASTQIPLATELEEKYSQIEKAVRFIELERKLFTNPKRDVRFYEENFYYADSSVFEVFNFPLIAGDPITALTQPNTAVVTQSTAQKYFGNEDPIGQSFINESNGDIYQVTGLLEDIPSNSHLTFDALLSFTTLPEEFAGWGSWYPITYLLLKRNTSLQEVEQVLTKVNKEHVMPIFENYGITINYWLQPLTDIHLKSSFGDDAGESGDISYIYTFVAIAFFMLIIASINYMNLATAHATRRAKEVGVRKTMGSVRSQLISQFLTESILITMVALLLSWMVVIVLFPYFNQFTGIEIDISYLLQPQIVVVCMGITLLVGILGGSYPAFYLSHFNPALVLKGNITRGRGNALLRKALVVVQFAISIAMLICTWVVYDQLQYMQEKDLGFKQNQVLALTMPDSTIQTNYPLLYNRLKDHANVLEVSTSSAKPGDDMFYSIMDVDSPEGVVDRGVDYYWAGYDFVETMGMNIVEGRNFSRDYATDTAAVLVNEAMVANMQWENPIGKRFAFDDGNEETPNPTYRVVGVVQNFHQQSLYSPIEPLAIFFGEPNYYLNIKIAPQDIKSTLSFIEDSWAKVNTGKPFSYNFLDQDFQSQYQADQKRGQIFTFFSALTVVIACLGLLGLTAYTTEQRAKEIGIRKVIGASVTSIIGLIYKDFLVLIVVAILIAFPVAYVFMNDWLQSFAYQTELKWLTFVASALLALVITMSAISFHTLRAAMSNPVNSLRNE